jgi:starch-binding outer membrane protein, SusD/RagB family
MKKHLNLIWLLIVALPMMTSISGCKKFLDRKPLGSATEGDLSQGGVEGKTFGLYGQLRTIEGMTTFVRFWFQNIRSDDALKGSTTGDLADGGNIMDNFQYTKDHWLMNQNWDGHFTFINATNDVIHDVDSLQLTDPGSIINNAEARFFRAFAYFDLVRDYGSVPIYDFKIYKASDGNKAKSTVAEVYAFIQADLTYAAANLPTSWPSAFVGRVTKGTANSLLVKVLMQQQKFSEALTKAEEVINSGQYSLLPSYQNFFKESGENSSESILEVQMLENATGSVKLGNNYNETQGVRGSGDWDLGWGFNVPSPALESSYEAGDPRRGHTILYSGQPDGIYGRTVPSAPPLAQPYWNKKVYTDIARQQATGDRFSYWLNIRLLRYADILLLAAEAANEVGGAPNTTKALAWLEMVRARARGGAAVLPAVVAPITQAALRTAIKKERRAELAMENQRFYDLVRWTLNNGTSAAPDGIDAITILGPLGYLPKNRFYPIPQPVLDRNNLITQNPDYP